MFFRRSIVAALAAGVSVVNAARNITVYNNDTSVQYTGFSWRPYTNCGGTTYTYSKGQFFSFTFFGTAVYVIGTESLEGGVINVSLDGQQTTFDRYAQPPYRCGIQYFGQTGLADGSHTITVTLVGNSPANSTTDGFLEWQWLLYTQLDASDQTGGIGIGTQTGISNGPSPTRSIGPGPTTSPAQKSSGASGAAIGGGVAGGLVVIAALAVGIWWCMRRNKNKDNYGKTDLGGGADAYPAAQPYPTSSPTTGGPGMSQAGGYNRTSISGGAAVVPGSTPWTPDPAVQASLNPGAGYPQPGQGGAYPGGFAQQPSYGSSATSPSIASAQTQPFLAGAAAGPTYGPGSQYGGGYPATPGSVAGAGNPFASGPNTTYSMSAPGTQQAYSAGGGSQSGYGANPGPNAMYNVSNPDPSPYPQALNPASTGYNPSTGGPGSSGSGGQMPGQPQQQAGMHDTDVDRIAARVATMMQQGQPAGYPAPAGGLGDYDAPPPMYNEKR